MSSAQLSLGEALASGRLADFVDQAEAAGVGPIPTIDFDAILGAVIAPLPEGQTSRSPAHGSKRGK
jgi:hypothetical protein